jgi:hypothetical protein
MQKTFETPGQVTLDLRIPTGEISIDPTLPDRVELDLIAHDEESERLLEEARIESRQTGGGYEVLVDVPSKRNFGLSALFGRTGITCRVRCPEGSNAELRTKSADVGARGTLGNVDVVTASGDVELRDVERALNVKSASGDLRAEAVGGDVTVQSASGDVSVESIGGRGKIQTVSGDLHVGEAHGDLTANSVSGDQFHAAVSEGNVRANSVSGDVAIGIRQGSRVYLDCNTVSGDTSSELAVSGEPVGDGPLVEVRAKTVSGDITITRASAPADNAQEVHA